MSAAAVGTHHSSGTSPLSLMSCVRESSPLQDYDHPHNQDAEKNAATKKKFWNPKKWFRRKNKTPDEQQQQSIAIEKDVLRSRSTSEISIGDEQQQQYNNRRRSGGPSIKQAGLSVSHDSVFHSPNSDSEIELEGAQSTNSLSVSHPSQIDLKLQSELSERLRLRRGREDTSEDDEGLPHSPCNSPTTTETLLLDKTAIKDLPTKSHSTCSDGSLLSMGSSEMDDDSSLGPHSRHSSKVSLHEKHQESELELRSNSQPLNHSAAHHRVSVRPNKRRAPHRNKTPQLAALPTTPEVNEESSLRSGTPETVVKETVSQTTTETTILSSTTTTFTSLPPLIPEHHDEEDKSFFDRIFPRRSGKKRKTKEETKPIAAPRSGPGSRQRIQPMEIQVTPELPRKEAIEEDKTGTSPLQIELENYFKHPPKSPTVISKTEDFARKFPLTPFQERLLHNDETDHSGFKSLEYIENKIVKPVAKSHSFKAPHSKQTEDEINMSKAASLDSVKHLETPAEDPAAVKNSGITISGPSHTAVVSISSSESYQIAKESVSVTRIQFSKETARQTPEFLGKQLNKVSNRSVTNVVLSMNSPRIIEEQVKPKKPVLEPLDMKIASKEDDPESPQKVTDQETVEINPVDMEKVRKFSADDVEIIDKSALDSPTGNNQPRFKKNEAKRKESSTPTSEKSFNRSFSLDSLKGDSELSSQDSLDKSEDSKTKSTGSEGPVLRRKSLIKQKNDEEPELMKVFARRSLKLKDNESDAISEEINTMIAKDNSDKENQLDSPVEERKKSVEQVVIPTPREPLVESVMKSPAEETKFIESTAEVTLRKPVNNNYYGFLRAKSELPQRKQSFNSERRKTNDHWIKNEEVKISQDEIITEIAQKNESICEEFIAEVKNFNQRKAEWEKRAQQAQKKSTP